MAGMGSSPQPDGGVATFASPDTDALFEVEDEDFAVAHFACARALRDGFDDAFLVFLVEGVFSLHCLPYPYRFQAPGCSFDEDGAAGKDGSNGGER